MTTKLTTTATRNHYADDDHRHVPRVSFERGPDTKTRGLYRVRIDLEPLPVSP